MSKNTNIADLINYISVDGSGNVVLTTGGQVATQSYVTTAVSNLVNSAPTTLDTLNELAAALGNDANFATTVTNSIATKLPLSGGTLTGALNGTSATFSGQLAINDSISDMVNIKNVDSSGRQGIRLNNGINASGGIVVFNSSSSSGTETGGLLRIHQQSSSISQPTAIFRQDGSADILQLQGASGAVRLAITSTGAATFSSSVSINNAEIVAKLDVVSSLAKTNTTFTRIASFRSNESLAGQPLELYIAQLGNATSSLQGISLQVGHYGLDFNANLILQKDGGGVGIGTSPTNGKLEIQQTSTTAGLWVQTGGTTSSYTIADFRTGTNAPALQLLGSGTAYFGGFVGMGVSNPGDRLVVNGNLGVTDGVFQSGESYSLYLGDKNAFMNSTFGQKVKFGAYNGFEFGFGENSNLTLSTSWLTISGNGRVGINDSNPSMLLSLGGGVGRKLHVYNDGGGANDVGGGLGVDMGGFSAETSIFFGNWGGNGRLSIGAWTSAQTYSTKVTINANGEFLVGTTVGTSTDPVHRIGTNGGTTYARLMIQERVGVWISFNTGSTNIGTIYQNGSVVVYGGQSDYRLKENVREMSSGLERIMKLRPVEYNWKRDGSHGEGFIAHELQEIVPLAVTGKKDGINEVGDPDWQNVDKSHIVPVLTKAVQELKAENDELREILKRNNII